MSTSPKRPRPVVLCVLDGWGMRSEEADNAVAQAATPNFDKLEATCPNGVLDASEQYVGLPHGQMGNSEVGHMNLGAGRVILQDLPRIDLALSDGSLAKSPELGAFVAALKKSGGTAHVMGLLSPGGVHSHQDQIAGVCRILADAGVPVAVHAFLDGRDTPPNSASGYLAKFLKDVAGHAVTLATIGGRFFGMDRDNRWDRVEAAYRVMVDGEGDRVTDAVAALEASKARGETDEFVRAAALADYAGMRDGDGVFMTNFRADRAREILTALLDPAFDGFQRPRVVTFAAALGMVQYSAALDRLIPAVFPSIDIKETIGAIVSAAGLTQLRIAETEKYAHVTFFFNGGEETVFAGEERILVPSPKVKTYDLQPEMSAVEITDKLVAAIDGGGFDFIVVNYANTDMVGHTGNLVAAVKAVETVDRCLGRLVEAVGRAGGALFVTADHGNAETMRDDHTGEPHTAHTLNLVPGILFGGPSDVAQLRHGVLADVAPTLLDIIGLPIPAAMTGRSLLTRAAVAA